MGQGIVLMAGGRTLTLTVTGVASSGRAAILVPSGVAAGLGIAPAAAYVLARPGDVAGVEQEVAALGLSFWSPATARAAVVPWACSRPACCYPWPATWGCWPARHAVGAGAGTAPSLLDVGGAAHVRPGPRRDLGQGRGHQPLAAALGALVLARLLWPVCSVIGGVVVRRGGRVRRADGIGRAGHGAGRRRLGGGVVVLLLAALLVGGAAGWQPRGIPSPGLMRPAPGA